MKVVHFFVLFSFLGIIACSQGETKKKTKGGYEYIVHKEGSGNQAQINDYLLYTIKTSTDLGKELQSESDYSQVQPLKIFDPAAEEAQGNIWNDVFINAKVGDSITLIMPTDSMPYPNPELEGAKSLLFTIAVKEILNEQAFEKFRMGKQEEFERRAAEGQKVADKIAKDIKVTLADYKAKKLALTELAEGVKVYYNEKGSGTQSADGKTVYAQYYGVLEDGTMFDNSFSRGQAFSFQVGQGMVIKGWDIAFANLRVGDKATIFIPAAVGYGAQGAGTIPPNAPLVFYVELEDVK